MEDLPKGLFTMAVVDDNDDPEPIQPKLNLSRIKFMRKLRMLCALGLDNVFWNKCSKIGLTQIDLVSSYIYDANDESELLCRTEELMGIIDGMKKQIETAQAAQKEKEDEEEEDEDEDIDIDIEEIQIRPKVFDDIPTDALRHIGSFLSMVGLAQFCEVSLVMYQAIRPRSPLVSLDIINEPWYDGDYTWRFPHVSQLTIPLGSLYGSVSICCDKFCKKLRSIYFTEDHHPDYEDNKLQYLANDFGVLEHSITLENPPLENVETLILDPGTSAEFMNRRKFAIVPKVFPNLQHLSFKGPLLSCRGEWDFFKNLKKLTFDAGSARSQTRGIHWILACGLTLEEMTMSFNYITSWEKSADNTIYKIYSGKAKFPKLKRLTIGPTARVCTNKQSRIITAILENALFLESIVITFADTWSESFCEELMQLLLFDAKGLKTVVINSVRSRNDEFKLSEIVSRLFQKNANGTFNRQMIWKVAIGSDATKVCDDLFGGLCSNNIHNTRRISILTGGDNVEMNESWASRAIVCGSEITLDRF